MTHHTCKHCGTRFPIDSGSLVSRHRTSEGVVAYVRCPHGHLGVGLLAPRRVGRFDPCIAA